MHSHGTCDLSICHPVVAGALSPLLSLFLSLLTSLSLSFALPQHLSLSLSLSLLSLSLPPTRAYANKGARVGHGLNREMERHMSLDLSLSSPSHRHSPVANLSLSPTPTTTHRLPKQTCCVVPPPSHWHSPVANLSLSPSYRRLPVAKINLRCHPFPLSPLLASGQNTNKRDGATRIVPPPSHCYSPVAETQKKKETVPIVPPRPPPLIGGEQTASMLSLPPSTAAHWQHNLHTKKNIPIYFSLGLRGYDGVDEGRWRWLRWRR